MYVNVSVSVNVYAYVYVYVLPALLTDPQVLLFLSCRIARQLEVLPVS